ncbi:MAG TPA: GAF domain-containing protein [Terriglobales bacterium]|nr:GAF domain-containing protein [Terriglobales bacterium]
MNSTRSSADPSDRRNHRRKNLEARQIPVDLGVSGGMISDLSESGACVRTAPGVQLNRGERLHFAVPDGLRPIQATCELAWAGRDGQAGLRFLVLSERSQQHIKEWLMHDDGTGETVWVPAPAQAMKASVNTTRATPVVPSAPTRPIFAQPTTAAPVAPPAPVVAVAQSVPKPQEKQAEARQRLAYALKLMAELTQLLTSADGAAIALREGDHIVCFASTGSAPEVGVRVQTDTGLTRECLRSGLIVRADDAQNDARVDTEACRALGIRSIVVVPLFSQGAAVGVLQVLSGKSAAFAHADVLLLPQVANLIMRLAEKRTLPAPEQASANPTGARAAFDPGPGMDAAAPKQFPAQAPAPQARTASIEEPDGGQSRIQLAPGAKAVWPKLIS